MGMVIHVPIYSDSYSDELTKTLQSLEKGTRVEATLIGEPLGPFNGVRWKAKEIEILDD